MGRLSSMQKKIEAMERRENDLLDQIGKITEENVELKIQIKKAESGSAKKEKKVGY